ncbi:hypothetical protein SEUCBS140593_003000 [Sporothrix eucalyptigena]|uniref:Cycloheximide resistance protein n=1 Tax=Sporothrix eucalyptigena TaxID=1812306 RepID=A0ABP0BB65_9PEZI
MPLGILEYRKLEHVPGTSPLSELGRSDLEVSQGIDPSLLKHDPTGTTVLVPQPSESPNDPLNWPRWKKEMFTVAIAYGCGCVGAVGPLLTSAFVPLAEKWDVPLARFTLGVNGSCIAAIALGSIVFNTLAVKIGKRPVYLISSVGLFVGCFWAAEAKSFASLSAARAITGLCMAPMEALVPASIADIWFVHERGYRTAIFNLGVLGGINLASPIAGAIIQYSSYRTCLLAMGAAFVVQTIMTFFFMPESAYHRTGALNIDSGNHRVEVEGAGEKGAAFEHRDESEAAPAAVADNGSNDVPLTFVQTMMPYSGYWDRVSFWRTLLQPFFMLASPIVIWATLLFTTCISWLVLISITLSQIFSAPPYNFSVSSVGASNLASFVATLLATAIAGPAIDGCVKVMSRKNGGTFEPEFRLPIMVTYLLFTATGFFAWGQSLYNQDSWAIPIIVCMGLINFGVQLGTTGVVAYVADSHRMQAAEAFAAMNFIKNMFAFGMTFYANDWIAVQGVRDCFFVIGGITVGVTLTTIPMYVYGKKARGFTAKHRLVKWIVE